MAAKFDLLHMSRTGHPTRKYTIRLAVFNLLTANIFNIHYLVAEMV